MPVANRLKQPLDRLYREFDWARRVEQDAIQFPLRYTDPADIEIAGLFASCMAYGRVDLFGALGQRGCSRGWGNRRPASSGASTSRSTARSFPDSATASTGSATCWPSVWRPSGSSSGHGSLGAFFLEGYSPEHAHVGPALEHFAAGLRRPGPLGRLSAQPALVRLQALVPAALDRRGVQAPAALPPLDGQARAARLRDLARHSAVGAPDARRHAHREHGALHRAHAPAQPQLARWSRRSPRGSSASIRTTPSSTTSPSATSACRASA